MKEVTAECLWVIVLLHVSPTPVYSITKLECFLETLEGIQSELQVKYVADVCFPFLGFVPTLKTELGTVV